MLAGPSPEPRGTGLPLSLFFSPRATSYSPGRSRGRDGRGGGAGEGKAGLRATLRRPRGSIHSDPASLPGPASLRGRPRRATGTHVRVIVHCGDQVLHQGLQGPRDETSILEDEVPRAAGPTASLPHAGLPLSTTAGPEDAGEDHGRLGHSFLGGKNGAVRHQRLLRPEGQPPGGPEPQHGREGVIRCQRRQRTGSSAALKPPIKVSDKHFLSICSVHTRPHSRDLDTERSASWGSIPAEKTNHGEEVKTAPGEHQVCRGGHGSRREAALRQTERELCGFRHKRGMFQVQGVAGAEVLRPGRGRGSAGE